MASYNERQARIDSILTRVHSPTTSKLGYLKLAEGWGSILTHQLKVQAPQTQERLHEETKRRKERQRKLRDESNKTTSRWLVKAHQAMNTKPYYTEDGLRVRDQLDEIVEYEVQEQKEHDKKSGKSNTSQPGWGRGGWRTKKQLGKGWWIKKGFENLVNRTLTDAEMENSQD